MIRKIIFLEMLLWGIATFLYSQDEISKITITHGPYLQNVGSNEATIVWITDKPSIGWVELASDGNGSFYAKEHPRYFDTSNGIKNTCRKNQGTYTGKTISLPCFCSGSVETYRV